MFSRRSRPFAFQKIGTASSPSLPRDKAFFAPSARGIRLSSLRHAKTAACTPRSSHFPKALLTEPNFLGAPNHRLCYIVSYSTPPRVKQIDVKFVSGLRRVYVGSMSGAPRFCSILQRLALPLWERTAFRAALRCGRERHSEQRFDAGEDLLLPVARHRGDDADVGLAETERIGDGALPLLGLHAGELVALGRDDRKGNNVII